MTDDKKRHYVVGESEGSEAVTHIPIDSIRDAVKNNEVHKRRVHDEAKSLVRLGFWVLPVARLGKGYPVEEFNANSASSNSKQIDKWFHPDSGRFAGWNLGIACGNKNDFGIIIADADRHGRGDGVKAWRELVQVHDNDIDHPWAITPNAGEHHFYRWHPSFAKQKTKIDGKPGLEFLGGKDGTFVAFALVHPSVVKNQNSEYKQYKWRVHPKDCMPPRVPDWLSQSVSVSKRNGAGRGNANVSQRDLEPIIPIEQVERMLTAIDPNDLSYDDWLRIGMAVHSQHPDRLETWDTWSQRGARYKSGECEKRWDGFESRGKGTVITVGTLFYHAKRFGWKPTDKDTHCDPVSLAVAKLNQTYAYVVVGGHARVLRLRRNHDVGEPHFDLLLPSAFRDMFPGQFVQHPSWNKPKPLPRAWMDSAYRRSYDFGLRLSPHKETPEGVFNTWSGFAYEPIEGDCSLFKAHVRDVICCGDPDLYIWVMDWAADCVQDPGDLKGTAIVMRGNEGTGKGTFANAIGRLFGAHYVHLTNSNHLLGNFNAHLIDAIIVFADEVTWGGNVKSQGKLKGLVTEQQLTGERKGIDAIQYRNFAHVIIASNADWVIPAGGSSRRWLVLDIDNSRANDRAYFSAIHQELGKGGYEALLYELQHREITSNLRWAPVTEALNEQRRLSAESRDKFFDFLDHKLVEGDWGTTIVQHPDHGMCLDKRQVHREYQQFTKDCGGMALSDVSFWKKWLEVFPYAKGGQKEWPRTRTYGGLTRLAVLRRRQEMCKDFLRRFGTASDEVRNATGDWQEVDPGC